MAIIDPHTILTAEPPRDPQITGGFQPDEAMALLNDAMKRIADLEALVKSPRPPAASGGKSGRKAVNADIAAFANERRPGMSWKEIYYAWKRDNPDDPRNKDLTPEKVRGDWRWHYGGKDGRQHELEITGSVDDLACDLDLVTESDDSDEKAVDPILAHIERCIRAAIEGATR